MENVLQLSVYNIKWYRFVLRLWFITFVEIITFVDVVYVEHIGASIKGTVLFVAADNLAAHSLGGFFESFTVSRMCQFCMAKPEEIQHKEVRTGSYQPRAKENHDRHMQDVLQDSITWCETKQPNY